MTLLRMVPKMLDNGDRRPPGRLAPAFDQASDQQVRDLSSRLGVDPEIAPDALLRAAGRPGAVDVGADVYERLSTLLGAAA